MKKTDQIAVIAEVMRQLAREILNEKDISVIVSNPPYIGDKSTVDPQTLKYEPHLALFASPKTKYYEQIFTLIDPFVLSSKFLMAFEIGEDMEEELTHILETKYIGIMYKFVKDICGKSRFLYIVKMHLETLPLSTV